MFYVCIHIYNAYTRSERCAVWSICVPIYAFFQSSFIPRTQSDLFIHNMMYINNLNSNYGYNRFISWPMHLVVFCTYVSTSVYCICPYYCVLFSFDMLSMYFMFLLFVLSCWNWPAVQLCHKTSWIISYCTFLCIMTSKHGNTFLISGRLWGESIAILQTTFSDTFSWKNVFVFRYKFIWNLFLIIQHWIN